MQIADFGPEIWAKMVALICAAVRLTGWLISDTLVLLEAIGFRSVRKTSIV
jgi:hypothetical protein